MKKASDLRNLRSVGLVWVGPLGFLAWLAWVCADDWSHDANYGHGWFILPLFFFFLWRRWTENIQREGVGESDASGRLPVFWLFPLPLLVAVIELVRLTPIFWRPIAWIIYFLGGGYALFLAWRQMGSRGLRWLAFPVLFLAVAIPWPTFIETNLVREFSFIIAAIVGEILLLLGIFNEVNGRVIELAQGSIGVDEACSGLRSLQSSLMISLAVGEWFWLRRGQRVALLLAAVAGAMVLNVFRALALSLLVARGGSEALNQWHDPVGLIALVALTGGIVGIGMIFKRSLPEDSLNRQEESAPTPERVEDVQVSTGAQWISGLCLAAFVTAHGWYQWNGLQPALQEPFVEVSRAEVPVDIEPTTEQIAAILRADAGGYLVARTEWGPQLFGYHFFWSPARTNGKALFHRPDVCMPGAGWVQEGRATLYQGQLEGRETVIHRFIFQRGTRSVALLWMCWADERPLEFGGDPYSYLQASFLPDFISMGKRVFSVEILALFAPVGATDAAVISQLIRQGTGMEFVSN